MESHKYHYVSLSVRHRMRGIVTAWLCSLLLILLVIRYIQVPYKAQINIFTTQPATSPTASLLPGSLGQGLSTFQRDTFISSQKDLLFSYPVFEMFKEKMDKVSPHASQAKKSIRQRISDAVQSFLFGRQYVLSRARERDIEFESFKGRLSFKSKLNAGSFSISYAHADPDLALKGAQFAAEALVEMDIKLSSGYSSQISNFLEHKVKQAKHDVEEISEAMLTFTKDHDFPDNSKMVEARYQTFLEIEKDLAAARAALNTHNVVLNHAKTYAKTLERNLRSKIAEGGTARIEALLSEVARFELNLLQQGKGTIASPIQKKLGDLRAKLSSAINNGNNPKLLGMDTLRQLLAEAERNVALQESEAIAAKQKVMQTEQIVAAHEANIKRYPELQSRLSQLLFDYVQYTKILGILTEQYLGSLVQSDAKLSRLLLFEKPALITHFLMYGKLQLFGLGALFAILLVCALGASLDLLRTTILSRYQLATAPHSKFLGAVPHLEGLEENDVISLARKTHNSTSQAYHLVQKLSNGRANGGKTVLITSSDMACGKSVSSLYLAEGLSKLHRSVLVLDCDHRAESRHLTNYYLSKDDNQNVHNLDTLVEGPITPTAGGTKKNGGITVATPFDKGLDASQKMDVLIHHLPDVINRLKEIYDVIILDGPPLFFTDSLGLLQIADGVILCCLESISTEKDLIKAVKTIEEHKKREVVTFSLMTNVRLKENLDEEKAYQYQTYHLRAA